MHDAWGNVTMEHMDSKVKSETTPENDVLWDNQARPTIRKESICIVLLLHIGSNFISSTGKQRNNFFWKDHLLNSGIPSYTHAQPLNL